MCLDVKAVSMGDSKKTRDTKAQDTKEQDAKDQDAKGQDTKAQNYKIPPTIVIDFNWHQ